MCVAAHDPFGLSLQEPELVSKYHSHPPGMPREASGRCQGGSSADEADALMQHVLED